MIRQSATEGRSVGLPTRHKRVTSRTLPADRDVRQWYFQHVILDGDFSAFDFRDCDLRDYELAPGTALGNMDWAILRNGVTAGAVIPSDVTSFNQDLVGEVMKQALPRLSGIPLQAAQVAISFVGASYTASWHNALYEIRERLALSNAELHVHMTEVFVGYPRLLARLRYHIENDDLGPEPAGAGITTTTPVRVLDRMGERLEDFEATLTGVTDRYAVARAIEGVLRLRGEETVCHVDQLDPWPNMQVVALERMVGTPEFSWWRKGWPT